MNTALVTGGNGLIGVNLANKLLENDYKVVSIDLKYNKIYEEKSLIQIPCSVLEKRKLSEIFKSFDVDYIYHFGGISTDDFSHFIRSKLYEVNIVGTANLINEAVNHNIKRFIFPSSASIYNEGVDLNENSEIKLSTPYEISKYASENDLRIANQKFGLNYTIFRLHNVFGSGHAGKVTYGNVVSRFIYQLKNGEGVTIFGDGTQRRQFTYILDILDPLLECLENEGAFNQTFNLGSDSSTTILELLEKVAKVLKVKTRKRYEKTLLTPIKHLCDHSKAQKTFLNIKETPFVQAIEEMEREYEPESNKSIYNYAPEIIKKLPDVYKPVI